MNDDISKANLRDMRLIAYGYSLASADAILKNSGFKGKSQKEYLKVRAKLASVIVKERISFV
jgi:hypothetical protein